MNNHLFARLCRVAGRFLLCAGGISLVGSIALVIAPFLIDADSNQTSITHQPTIIIKEPAQPAANLIETLPYIIISVFLIALILIAIVIVMRKYNDDIRQCIGRLARLFRLSIQITELALTVFAWGAVVLLTAFHAPLFSIFALFLLIINELLFIFAWTAYGGKNYTA